MLEKKLDKLIEAGWNVLKTDYDPIALREWREQACECMSDLLGPDRKLGASRAGCITDKQSGQPSIGGAC